MKLDYLKSKKEFISRILVVVSIVFAVCISIKVVGFFTAAASAKTLVAEAIAQSEQDPNDMEKYFTKSREMADELKKKNLFAPPAPKQHPVKQVSGILGNEALINGKWYKVGDQVADANIVSIEPTLVKIEWNGSEKTFAPIGAASAGGPGPGMRKGPGEGRRGRGRRMEQPARTVQGDVPEFPGPPEMRGRFLERWNQMSDEERQRMRERFRQRRGGGGQRQRQGDGGQGRE